MPVCIFVGFSCHLSYRLFCWHVLQGVRRASLTSAACCLISTCANGSAHVLLSFSSSSSQKPDQAVLGARKDTPAMLDVACAHFRADTTLNLYRSSGNMHYTQLSNKLINQERDKYPTLSFKNSSFHVRVPLSFSPSVNLSFTSPFS